MLAHFLASTPITDENFARMNMSQDEHELPDGCAILCPLLNARQKTLLRISFVFKSDVERLRLNPTLSSAYSICSFLPSEPFVSLSGFASPFFVFLFYLCLYFHLCRPSLVLQILKCRWLNGGRSPFRSLSGFRQSFDAEHYSDDYAGRTCFASWLIPRLLVRTWLGDSTCKLESSRPSLGHRRVNRLLFPIRQLFLAQLFL